MKNKEIQSEIHRRLSKGESKSSVFKLLSGQSVPDRVIAHQIASYADQNLCNRYSKLIDAMIVISWLQFVLVMLFALALGLSLGWLGGLLVAVLLGAFAYLFVWGFSRNKAWAYTLTIVLSAINLPNAIMDFSKAPIASAIGLAISIGLISFAWYVRRKIFPDFVFISPKKVKGSFVFSS